MHPVIPVDEGSLVRPGASRGEAVAVGARVVDAPLAIHLLGGFAVTVCDAAIPHSAWRRRAAGQLVKLLALTPGHRMHRDEVVENLWPELAPGRAANHFHHALHTARHVLEPDLAPRASSTFLHLEQDMVVLDDPARPAKPWVDVDAFEAAASIARRTRDPSAYSTALALYVGDLLPEDRYTDWVIGRREQLRLRYTELLRQAAQAQEARGHLPAAIEALGRLIAAEPTDERTHVVLMRLFALAGHRDRALRQYRRLRDALRREFGAEPQAASRRLYQELLAEGADLPTPSLPARQAPRSGSPGTVRRPAAVLTQLPCGLTSFIGRQAEQAEVRALLHTARLVTLTGAGGCGKTRLALEAAASLSGEFADGVLLVELAALADPGRVPTAVARCLEVPERPGQTPSQTLVEVLSSRHLLLVLDNCEHLADACASLAEVLLAACPGLYVLATSRERLRCAGETPWPVPPLLAPDPEQRLPLVALDRYDAVRLFVARAQLRQSSFALTTDNAPAIARICHRVGGIPLAIELAAARLQVLSVYEVAAGLDDALGLLAHGDRTAPPRHQTMRATLDWSYSLLSAAEQALLRRLSVFAGGFTRDAAECVTTDGDLRPPASAFLDLLADLVDKSLVIVDRRHTHRTRYSLLETVRQYGLERLRAAGEEVRVRQRHRDWCLQLAEDGAAAMDSSDQAEALERLEADSANLQAALGWCLERAEIATGLGLAGVLWRFWYQRGHVSEGRSWLEALLASPSVVRIPAATQARALLGVGWCAFHQGDLEIAAARFTAGLALHRELGDDAGAAVALLGLGNVAEERGDLAASASHYQESLALERQLGEPRRIARALDHLGQWAWHAGNDEQALLLADEALALRWDLADYLGTAKALCNRGVALEHLGDLEAAASALGESMALRRRLGDSLGVAVCAAYLARIAFRRGDVNEAAGLCSEVLRISRTMGIVWGIEAGLLGLASVLRMRGQPERAARLLGAVDALTDATGVGIKPGDQALVAEHRELVRAQLGVAEFQAALDAGRRLPLHEAIDAALAIEASSETTTPRRSGAELTAREQEIELMVASGRTNRQIAAELSLSERTVDTHVSRILRKRGISGRTRLATRAQH